MPNYNKEKNAENFRNLSVNLPIKQITLIDGFRDAGFFPSRSEGLRIALKEYLIKLAKEQKLLDEIIIPEPKSPICEVGRPRKDIVLSDGTSYNIINRKGR